MSLEFIDTNSDCFVGLDDIINGCFAELDNIHVNDNFAVTPEPIINDCFTGALETNKECNVCRRCKRKRDDTDVVVDKMMEWTGTHDVYDALVHMKSSKMYNFKMLYFHLMDLDWNDLLLRRSLTSVSNKILRMIYYRHTNSFLAAGFFPSKHWRSL